MVPFKTNGDYWRVIRVSPGDPRLIDRTGKERLATTDPVSKTISVSEAVKPPLLDQVMLHEVSHAVGISSGATARLRGIIPSDYWIGVEEWAANMTELYAIESIGITSRILGRPVCIRGFCND